MKLQPNNHSCGVYVVHNALKALGIRGNIKTITTYTGTTIEHGTNENGIVAALMAYELKPEKFVVRDKDSLLAELNGSCDHSNLETGDIFDLTFPIIACVDNFKHWVLILQMVGDRFIVIDSNNTKENKAESGVHILTFKQLAKRWRGPNGGYFGIVCDCVLSD